MQTFFSRIDSADEAFRLWLTGFVPSKMTVRLLRLYTRLGDGYVWALALAWIVWVHDLRVALSILVRGLVAGAVSLVLYEAVKFTVRRPRPFRRIEGVTADVPPMDRWSFPSGHVMNNLAAGFVVGWQEPTLLWVLVPMPLSWGLLRVYFGVHYLSDIIAGALLGILCAYAGTWIYAAVG